MRRKRSTQITTSTSKDNGDCDQVNENDSTDNLIVSKDYYDEYSSSDDSVDEVVKTKQLVYEMSNEDDSECDVLERQHDQPQGDIVETIRENCNSPINVIPLKNNENVIDRKINDDFGNKLVMVNQTKNINDPPLETCTNHLQTFCSNILDF